MTKRIKGRVEIKEEVIGKESGNNSFSLVFNKLNNIIFNSIQFLSYLICSVNPNTSVLMHKSLSRLNQSEL